MSKHQGQLVKTLHRYVDLDEAKKAGAFSCQIVTFPKDPWGTTTSLVVGVVRERVYKLCGRGYNEDRRQI